ncbi:MAG: hypothetical protein PUC51_00225 [Ruminococcus sp.]|nr:hypothetical protein [Ruminococcus sp.]
MKKKTLIMVLTGCMVLSPVSVYAADATETTTEAEVTETAAQEDSADSESTGELGDDIYSFSMEFDGQTMKFPMTYQEFTDMGWELSSSEDPDTKVSTNSYGMLTFNKGASSVYADVINLGINEVGLEDCLIGGISVDGSYDVDLTAVSVKLPGDIELGKATLDDIKAAYGEPSDTYEGDLYTKLTYEKDSYQEVELSVFKDDNTLKEVDMRNFEEPEDYDKGTVSDEVPDIVTSYETPTALGDDMMDTAVEYMGDLYSLPAPVSAFTANGWEIQDAEDTPYVEGGGIAFIDMMKNNQSIHFSVYNETENATALENCFVRELSFATYDPESIAMKLSGDITLGADKAELIKMADEKGYISEENDDYLRIYPNKDSKIRNYVEFWFNKDEDSNKAASVTAHHE